VLVQGTGGVSLFALQVSRTSSDWTTPGPGSIL